MDGTAMAWVIGGYLAGTFPSTLVLARLRHAEELEAASGRRAGETDPHILATKYLGAGWSSLASATDVLKAMFWALGARHWGHLGPGELAVVGLAVVAGHSFPFYARQMAGRGMAAAAGVLLALLPVEMVVAGLLIVAGAALRATGLASTIGMASVAPVAAIQGQPSGLVAMGAGIFALIVLRRLEGVSDVVSTGVPRGRAALYRAVFDSSGPPASRRARR